MIIDLTPEEWDFLHRMVNRLVALCERPDKALLSVNEDDYSKAKTLLEKFVKGKDDH